MNAKLGEPLPNGAICIADRAIPGTERRAVLALCADSACPYAVWSYAQDNCAGTWMGQYFMPDDLAGAVAAWERRDM